MTAWLVWLWVGCAGDPKLEAQQRAVEAWERARVALDAKDPEAAEAEIAAALREDPDDPVLGLWWARAAADAGRIDVGLARLDALLANRPGYAPALYDRAAYQARAGDPDAAAVSLAQALAAGFGRTADQIRADPDFEPWLDHPAIASLVPEPPLRTALEGPDGSVFRGSQFAVHLRVLGAGDVPITIAADALVGPITLVGAVEQIRQSTAGAVRDVTFTFRVEGAGPIRLGPVRVVAGRRTAAAGEVAIEAFAPPGLELPPPVPLAPTFLTPTEVRADADAPSATRRDGAVVVVGAPGDRVEVTPAAEGTRYELRGDEGVLWVAWRYPAAVSGVRVRRRGDVVLDVRL